MQPVGVTPLERASSNVAVVLIDNKGCIGTLQVQAFVDKHAVPFGTVKTNRGQPVHRDTAESAAELLDQLPNRTRYMLSFAPNAAEDERPEELVSALRADGFVRAIAGGRMLSLDELQSSASADAVNRQVEMTHASATEDRIVSSRVDEEGRGA